MNKSLVALTLAPIAFPMYAVGFILGIVLIPIANGWEAANGLAGWLKRR